MTSRQRWGTRVGLILAMAGNAVGLGNFLRFPVQAASNGGGAFMIPYFISFLLLGIPLMWVEWTIGRYGGSRGHGSTPGMFQALWVHPIAKYLGVIGVVGPLLIVVYYSYVESWTLAFSLFALAGKFPHPPQTTEVAQVLAPYKTLFAEFIGAGSGMWMRPSLWAYLFFLITLYINVWVLARGISRGIEVLAKVAMPTLFLFAVLLAIRVLTLGHPVSPTYGPWEAMNFLWKPQLEKLGDWKIWLAAAGQIFFTLSVGMGAIHTYASYLNEKDDIALSGLATAATNEFAEVVLGASIAIPAAVAFFGLAAAQEIARSGAFSLGFFSMPAALSMMPLGRLFGFLWFGLLFFAGITSSVALSQPAVAFLEDELKWTRKRAAYTVGAFIFLSAHLPIFLNGALDELDFWLGTFGIVLFALMETVIFVWIFGADRAFSEMLKGADIQIPRFFYHVLKYVTPVMLIAIMMGWFATGWLDTIRKASPSIWITRVYILLVVVLGLVLIRKAFARKNHGG
ncbi:MAG: sodium-dependent transporter, partial [Candidatus Hydrothermae bacterium]|nr:sodium-dependent transporter [Candidatus Hydrothermae bacterium]